MLKREIRLTRIKQLRVLRVLVSPFEKKKIERIYQEYLRSDDYRRLEQLRDAHKGERCFIIGNGPSLRAEDLDKLKNEYTFAANRIYEMFDKTSWRPNAYVAVDADFLRTERENLIGVPCEFKFLPFRVCCEMARSELGENTILIWLGQKSFEIVRPAPWADKSAHIPDNVARGFSEGRTVTFDAIQMAIHMGFREIYLLGVDFNYSKVIDERGQIRNVDGVTDYFNDKTYDTTLQYYIPTKYAYIASREYCENHCITIRNATRGGKLEVFERVDFDALFMTKEEL